MIRIPARFLVAAILLSMLSTSMADAKLLRTKTATTHGRHFADAPGRLNEIVRRVESSNAISLIGEKKWRALLASHREALEGCRTHAQFAAVVNRLFHACGVSHFKYYIDEDWGYWTLRGALGPNRREAVIEHIGVVSQRINGQWFVRGILEGSVAEPLDIRVGDELLSVDGEPFQPIESFRGKDGQPVALELQRKPGVVHAVSVTPIKESLYDAMQGAIRKSISLVSHDGLSLAYLHGWTLLGDGREYADLLQLQGEVDGLLLDYRDGHGGTWHVASRFLLGDHRSGDDARWTKPVVILTADGTRSAKEIVVDAVRKADRAPLIGSPTPGHVTSVGDVVAVGEDGLLMLPGVEFSLEGKPTRPDVLVERDIRYCAGTDIQLDTACEILAELIRPQRQPPPIERPDRSPPLPPSPERRAP